MTEKKFADKENKPSGISHSFDTGIARACGFEAAILYNHICYWLTFNRTNPACLKEGKIWVFQSHEQLADTLGYMSVRQVKEAMMKLLKCGFLVKGNFNSNAFNKTNWYSLPDENILGDSKNSYESTNSVPSSGQNPDDRRYKICTIDDTNSVPCINRSKIEKTKDIENNTPPNPQKGEAAKAAKPAKAGIERENFGSVVKLSKKEHEDLCKVHGQEVIAQVIEEMNDYCLASRPKGYADYAAALRQWLRKREKEGIKVKKERKFAPCSDDKKALAILDKMKENAL